MKKYLVISMVLALLSTTQLFAFTPHINKGRIEEISVAQACAEMRIPEAELKELNKEFYGVLEDNNDVFPATVEVAQGSPIQIFRQTFAETDEVLYRVFLKTVETADGTPCMFQKGYYANGTSAPNLIFANFYAADFRVYGQSVTRSKLNSNFMPIIKKNKIAGIMIYEIERYEKEKSLYEMAGYERIVNHKAAVYWNDDFSTADLRNTYSNEEDIHIDCSTPLIDKNDVFRYTIQNAFDKNPATSYVEDTEDDLMYVCAIKPKITKFAIINGYAANKDLYFSNNRIIEVADEWTLDSKYPSRKLLETNNRYKLRDDYMAFQIGEYKTFSNGYIFVSKISKGKKYSDTCLAEIDFYNEEMGWLFGGVE